MISILIAASVGLVVSILLTPYLIRFFSKQGFGQEIREEGPEGHKSKRGTPTMGGVAILIAMVVGYFVAHLVDVWRGSTNDGPTASGLLVLFLSVGLGIVGFVDDFIKIRKQRNLGLNKTAKLVGQLLVAVVFAILVLQFPDENGLTPAVAEPVLRARHRAHRVPGAHLHPVLLPLISAWSNAVNFTDGLDGLAGGAGAMVLRDLCADLVLAVPHTCVDRPRPALLQRARPVGPRGGRGRGRPGPASASCGGTPRRPRSSWATPVRWRSAGRRRTVDDHAAPNCWPS